MPRLTPPRLLQIGALCALCVAAGVGVVALSDEGEPGIVIEADYPNARLARYEVASAARIHLRIAADPGHDEALWFRFRVRATAPVRPVFVLDNAAQASQQNWHVVRPVFSRDGRTWVPASDAGFEDSLFDKLRDRIGGRKRGFAFTAPFAAAEFEVAYAYPYDRTRLEALLTELAGDAAVTRAAIGASAAGHDIPLVTFGSAADDAREVWIVAREHPGEAPSSYVAEGLMRAVLATASRYDNVRFQVVPMLNIDGVERGYYYHNADGIDLARDWRTRQATELRALFDAMQPSLAADRVALVVNLHAANAPLAHFLIAAQPDTLPQPLQRTQARLRQLLDAVHPQFSLDATIDMWTLPGICGNYLPQAFGVYCLYLESNYSIGADGSRVSPASLRAFGAGIATLLAEFLADDNPAER